MLRAGPKSESVSWRGSRRRAVEASYCDFLRSRFGFLVVAVIFVGGHRFLAAFFPDALVGGKFSERARHFADVRGHRAAARADVIHAELARLARRTRPFRGE